jgi:D-alanyl-D-alanine carboxypeptidase
MTTRLKQLLGTTALLLVICLRGVSQEPAPPSPSPSPTATPEAEATRPLYGVQGVLVETLDGKVVSSQAENEQFNPASTMKLATALMALKTLGPDHRFATAVWTDGQLDRATGQINGNLYVSGRDPSFHYEHAILIARELNTLGIKKVTGDLFVAPGFIMNFSGSAKRSGDQFCHRRSRALELRVALAAHSSLVARQLPAARFSRAAFQTRLV